MSCCMVEKSLCDPVHEEKDPTPILCDNSSTIALSKNHVLYCKSKHIHTHYHFNHDLVKNGDIIL